VLSYVNYGTRSGMVPSTSGEYLAMDVDEAGDVGQGSSLAEAQGARFGGSRGGKSGAQEAEAVIAACLAGTLQAAYHQWSEQELSHAEQSAGGAGQRARSARGVGLIGKVDIDGSVDLFSEAVMAAGGTIARARVYADVAAALANLGASPSSSEIWEHLSKGLLRLPLQDLEAKTVIIILNAVARSRQLQALPNQALAARVQQHLLEATRAGIFGRMAAAPGNSGWPVEDASIVSAVVNSLSRNELFDEPLFRRLSQHIQARALPCGDGEVEEMTAAGAAAGAGAGGGWRGA